MDNITLGDKRTFRKEVLRVGEWFHHAAPEGKLRFTPEYLQTLADNYKNHTPYAPVIRGHQDNKTLEENPNLIIAPNIKKLEVEGNSLMAEWEMDADEAEKYADVSVSIEPDYVDHKSGKNIGDILTHIAMVVNPYIKTLSSFVPLGESTHEKYIICLSEVNMPEEPTKVEEIVEPAKEESQPEAEVTPEAESVKTETEPGEEVTEEPATQEPDVPATVAENSEEAKTQLAEANATIFKLRREIRLKEAEATYSKYLSDGRVTPAAKETFMALAECGDQAIELSDGKSVKLTDVFVKFLDMLPKSVNLSERGVQTEELKLPVSEAMYTSLRESYFARNKGATDQQFAEHINKHADTIAKYEEKKKKN